MFNLQHSFATLGNQFYSLTCIHPLKNQRLVQSNAKLSQYLGIDFKDEDTHNILCGNTSLAHSLSMVYAGHQFGGFSPQLGDGRGVLLGEISAKDGLSYDLHMKGAGLTPYSRQGDGRAVLRSCIREYLASEAIAGLGIATSRALALYDSEHVVFREQAEKGAMLLRTARSHIRFGHFEYFFYQKKHKELNALIEYCLEQYFPYCKLEANPIVSMLNEVVDSTALMIAKWQSVGFQHGVMNTDNMSLLGETIDYGPYEFMNDYNPLWVCNHSDYEGRYAFERQPGVALWNLNCLIHCFSNIIERDQLIAILSQYEEKLIHYYKNEMRAKLGLKEDQDEDRVLLANLLALLEKEAADYSIFFRNLSSMAGVQDRNIVLDECIDRVAMNAWLDNYVERRASEGYDWQDINVSMCSVNPKFILRNYLAQEAIEKAQVGDYSYFDKLLTVLATPFAEHTEHTQLAQRPPEWGKKMTISCSS